MNPLEPGDKVTFENSEWTVRKAVGSYVSLVREDQNGNNKFTVQLAKDLAKV